MKKEHGGPVLFRTFMLNVGIMALGSEPQFQHNKKVFIKVFALFGI
jgi:hypothetical protein